MSGVIVIEVPNPEDTGRAYALLADYVRDLPDEQRAMYDSLTSLAIGEVADKVLALFPGREASKGIAEHIVQLDISEPPC